MRSRIIVTVLTAALFACGGSNEAANTATLAASATSTTVPATPTPTSPFSRGATVNETQTIDGLELTLTEIGIGAPSGFVKLSGGSTNTAASKLSTASSVVVVYFSAKNPTPQDQSIHTFTGTTGLVNDEQLDADFLLSDLEATIRPGALVDMYAVFLSTRYAPSAINRVRFSVEKRFTFENTGTFDFDVSIP